MISDTSHLFRQLQLAFCLKKEEKRRARERRGRRERRGETEGEIEGRWGGRVARQTRAECEGWRRTVEGWGGRHQRWVKGEEFEGTWARRWIDQIKIRRGGWGGARREELRKEYLQESLGDREEVKGRRAGREKSQRDPFCLVPPKQKLLLF